MFNWFESTKLAKRFQRANEEERAALLSDLHHGVRPSSALKVLSLAVEDGNPRIRYSAAVELSHFEQPEANYLLATFTHDDDPCVAQTAARVLLERNWQPEKPVEKRRLHIARLEKQSREGTVEQRKAALLTLARIDDPCALSGQLMPPMEIARQLAEEAEPESLHFLKHAAQNYGTLAAIAVRGLITLLQKHGSRLPATQLRELAVLEDVNQGETVTAPAPPADPTASRHRPPGANGKDRWEAATQDGVRFRVTGKVSCRQVRDLARQELTRREKEQEQRKKYFCPECSQPLRVEKSHLGRRIECPACRHQHICSAENFC